MLPLDFTVLLFLQIHYMAFVANSVKKCLPGRYLPLPGFGTVKITSVHIKEIDIDKRKISVRYTAETVFQPVFIEATVRVNSLLEDL